MHSFRCRFLSSVVYCNECPMIHNLLFLMSPVALLIRKCILSAIVYVDGYKNIFLVCLDLVSTP